MGEEVVLSYSRLVDVAADQLTFEILRLTKRKEKTIREYSVSSPSVSVSLCVSRALFPVRLIP